VLDGLLVAALEVFDVLDVADPRPAVELAAKSFVLPHVGALMWLLPVWHYSTMLLEPVEQQEADLERYPSELTGGLFW